MKIDKAVVIEMEQIKEMINVWRIAITGASCSLIICMKLLIDIRPSILWNLVSFGFIQNANLFSAKLYQKVYLESWLRKGELYLLVLSLSDLFLVFILPSITIVSKVALTFLDSYKNGWLVVVWFQKRRDVEAILCSCLCVVTAVVCRCYCMLGPPFLVAKEYHSYVRKGI